MKYKINSKYIKSLHIRLTSKTSIPISIILIQTEYGRFSALSVFLNLFLQKFKFFIVEVFHLPGEVYFEAVVEVVVSEAT